MIRIASFNVENLLARPKAFNTTNWSAGKPALDAYREVNDLLLKPNYSADDKNRIRDLLVKLDIYLKNSAGAVRRKYSKNPRWAWLRKNRGKFDRQPRDVNKDIEIFANGRSSWIGWIELAKEPINEIGTRLTARVIKDVGADIIGIVEAEDRPSLVRFNREMLGDFYEHVMLVDGNDERGIDVGIMTRDNFEIETIRSNVDVEDNVGQVFSRDCPQYEVRTPSGVVLHMLVNHFKSQSGGGGLKRRRQAEEVRRIVDGLVSKNQHVVVLGDFNEGPTEEGSQAENLAPLFNNNSPLVDCYSLSGFDVGKRQGTYDSCGLRNRLDYIQISKSLQAVFAGGSVFRKGLWGSRKTRPDKWDTYSEMNGASEQASDHGAVYIDLNI
jgi:endonuclease/exonuclease/phosphatase family metal-dependent hydrolase